MVDFAYRAVHESTVTTKALVAKFYDRPARLSCWNGGSTGGRQGLMEAQKFPDDFDAIVAGAPANYQTHLHTWDLSVAVPVLNNPAAALTQDKLNALRDAAVNTCDAQDGVKDGLISNPRVCKFDPAVLLCKGADGRVVSRNRRSTLIKRAYSATKTAERRRRVSGQGTRQRVSVDGVSRRPAGAGRVGQVVPGRDNDANWDATFDVDKDLKIVDEKVGSVINAVNPDLSAFKAHGGKLLMYHGWNDTAISPGNSINYYERAEENGRQADEFVRLYMAPACSTAAAARTEPDQPW